MIYVKRNEEDYLIECEGIGLVISRKEAEDLFVALGYALQDHDMEKLDDERDKLQDEDETTIH